MTKLTAYGQSLPDNVDELERTIRDFAGDERLTWFASDRPGYHLFYSNPRYEVVGTRDGRDVSTLRFATAAGIRQDGTMWRNP